jgi:hypothetical protein
MWKPVNKEYGIVKELCVVHLVRAQNGIEPFKRFLESYLANSGGIEHDLLIVFKGFAEPSTKAEYLKLLSPYQYSMFDVSDEGFDITAYFAVLERYSEQYQYFCFLNSYSVILDQDWLKKLHENITKPEVGLVGATGSWQTIRGYLPAWKLIIAKFIESYRLQRENRKPINVMSAINEAWHQSLFLMKTFPKYPNYHIRTNAFMIQGSLMKSLDCPHLVTKMDAYIFESGQQGLTRKILKVGKRALIVGKDGRGYEKEDWHKSMTFRQANQENLLVSDNQTSLYQHSSREERSQLSAAAWGIASQVDSNA